MWRSSPQTPYNSDVTVPSNSSLPRVGDRGSRHRWNYPFYLYNRSLESLKGEHAPEDPQKSFLLNAEAAKSGMRDAVLAMGWFYLNGVGVQQDEEQAQGWYRKSARQGDPRAMFSLGQMAYDCGDHADALVWFRRVADKGHARSSFWIGKLFWRGHGVPVDRRQARALFQKAATEKVPAAQRVLKFLSRNTAHNDTHSK
jgi:TPR repeat protein